jgi:homocitrate synthase NifV
MRHDFIFIDQTLKCALRRGRIDITGFVRLKRQIKLIERVLFDLPLSLLPRSEDPVALDLHDVRLEIKPQIAQVHLAAALGCRQVKIKLTPETSAEEMGPVLAAARKYGMRVTLRGIDIGRCPLADIDFYKRLAESRSFDHLIIDDCHSRLDPLATHGTLREWRELLPAEPEYCGRNQLGLAAGNALGAVKSGVRRLMVSVGGVGGFPAWEEVGMGINRLLKLPLTVPTDLALLCRDILAEIGVEVGAGKPIIGPQIFAHESGIHVDGVYKRSELYEPFAPEDVGLARRIIIGKHSGKAALEAKLKELGFDPTAPDIPRILEKVRQLAVAQKAPVIDTQLRQLVKEVTLL